MKRRANGKPLYEEVADRLSSMIADGTYGPGTRIPSIRTSSRSFSVAISTVMEAYRLLEDRGLVVPIEKSGYFVRGTIPGDVPRVDNPISSTTTSTPAAVSVSNFVVRTAEANSRDGVVALGAAVASSDYLPGRKLAQLVPSVVRGNPEVANSYLLPPGLLALRVQVARRCAVGGCSIGPDDLVVTSGTTEALHLALRAVTRPGDVVAIESPTYFGLLHLLEVLELRAVEVRTDPRSGLVVDDLERMLETSSPDRPRAVVTMPNVHNPLGCTMPDDRKQRLARLAAEHAIPVIEDDTYGELAYDGHRSRCLRAFDDSGYVVLCGSLSKTLAPGYRVGWIAPGRWSAEIRSLKAALSLATAAPMQLVVAEYLAGGGFDRHLRRLRRTFRTNVRRMREKVVASMPTPCRVTSPSGGHLLWVELPPEVDSRDVFERALERGVAIAPGVVFSVDDRFANYIRLNAGLPWTDELASAIDLLGEVVRRAIPG